jgi:hypothetical protein
MGPGALALLSGGQLAVTGQFFGPTAFGGGIVTASGTDDAYVLTLDTDGGFVSVRTVGGADPAIMFGNDSGRALVQVGGAVVLAGGFRGTADFGSGTVVSVGAGTNAFVAALTDTSARWTYTYGDTRFNFAEALAATDSSVWVGGYYEGNPDFGDGPATYGGIQDAVIVRLDAAYGAFRWARYFGGPGFERVADVAVRADGASFAVGSFQETVDLGDGVTKANGERDAFLVSYDVDGTLRFARALGGVGCDFAGAVLLEPDTVWVAGAFEQQMSIGGFTVDSAGEMDAFLAGFSHDGTPLSLSRAGGARFDGARGLVRLPNGTLLLAGSRDGPTASCVGGVDANQGDAWIIAAP